MALAHSACVHHCSQSTEDDHLIESNARSQASRAQMLAPSLNFLAERVIQKHK